MAMVKGGEIILESNYLSARKTVETGFEAHCCYSWNLEHCEFLGSARVGVIWAGSVRCQARMSHEPALDQANLPGGDRTLFAATSRTATQKALDLHA